MKLSMYCKYAFWYIWTCRVIFQEMFAMAAGPRVVTEWVQMAGKDHWPSSSRPLVVLTTCHQNCVRLFCNKLLHFNTFGLFLCMKNWFLKSKPEAYSLLIQMNHFGIPF